MGGRKVRRFPEMPAQPISVHAPGRIELLGNHTDYNEGYVLSAAIDLGVTITGGRSTSGSIEIHSLNMNVSASGRPGSLARTKTWADYPFGVFDGFAKEGFPVAAFTAEVSGTLPAGAGLSSSAALEVATATFLAALYNLEITPLDLAKLCRKAENEFVGVNCGLLDQVSSVFGQKNHVIFLDCRNETVETLRFPEDIALLVIHSGVSRVLVGGEYNERRERCFEAARLLGAGALRDVTLSDLVAARSLLPSVTYKRALHVVGENERVLRGVTFLREGDIAGFGKLMFESHESSRFNFENSSPELDDLVLLASKEEAIIGSRLTGGGFGGATVSLIKRDAAAAAARNIKAQYKERTGYTCNTYVCEIAEGAHLL